MRLDDKDFDDLEIEDIETVKKRIERKKKGRKRRRGRDGASLSSAKIPLFAGAVILLLIIIISVGKSKVDEIKDFKVNADRAALFGGLLKDEAGIILNDGYEKEAKAFVENGRVYIPYDYVRENLNDWFYYDEKGDKVLYTTPEGTETYDQGEYITKISGMLCLSADLLKKYTDIEYKEYLEDDAPYIHIRNTWGKHSVAEAAKKTAVRTERSNDSDILADVEKGGKVRVLDPGDEWTGIQTEEGLTGYVITKNLTEYKDSEDAAPGKVPEMEFPSTGFNQKIVLGWHQVTNKDANNGVYDILIKDTPLNVLSPTWYALSDTEGGFTDLSSPDYVKAAHDAGKQVWAVIDNFNCTDFSAASGTEEVLSYTDKRQRLTDALVESVKASGADGINVDFENLAGETGVDFAQFIKELSVKAHGAGLLLSVDNYVPEAHSMHYYRGVQGKVCDFVVIMGYDEYNAASTEPGPVASLDYVENGIEKTLTEVDASKVINGLPFYSRIWETDNGAVKGTRALPMTEAAETLAAHNVTPAWDDGSGCNYGEYESEGSLWRLWLEDRESMNAKLSMMDGYSLAGAAFWKLGLEDSSIWPDIEAYAIGNVGGSAPAGGEEAAE
ncbi:MAG: hypothetical protein K5668_07290 [Lachnospiraceae bacterium]|nr:hypothetical protein [Lachnospiraceae bacterium]